MKLALKLIVLAILAAHTLTVSAGFWDAACCCCAVEEEDTRGEPLNQRPSATPQQQTLGRRLSPPTIPLGDGPLQQTFSIYQSPSYGLGDMPQT